MQDMLRCRDYQNQRDVINTLDTRLCAPATHTPLNYDGDVAREASHYFAPTFHVSAMRKAAPIQSFPVAHSPTRRWGPEDFDHEPGRDHS